MYRIQVKYSLTLLLFFFTAYSAFSQTDKIRLELFATQLQTLSKNAAPELAYIQTNKGLYENLEDLWFKVYLLNAQTFAPSKLSSTLYLQMMKEINRQVVWEEKYEAQNGFAEGHVFLQDTLPVGDYLLVAYTSASFVGDSAEIKAVRRITIKKEVKDDHHNQQNPPQLPTPTLKGPIQFNTFPESGNLVSGIKTKLAFKAVNRDGMPLDIKGTLFENTIPLVQFNSTHAGMGNLDFTPVAGKRYHIRIGEPAIDSTFLLPEVYPEGFSLHLANRNGKFLEFLVTQTPTNKKNRIYLRGQVRGTVYCMAMGMLQKELKIKIPLKEFTRQGIAEFTLFNDSLVPVAERLVYVNPEKKLHIETQVRKERYETREKVTLKINVKDERGEPITANLGISVYDKLYSNLTDPENIMAHYYLTSQIKGRLYNPAYYFDPKNNDRQEALDLLLLTQGWRRYVWSENTLKELGNTKHPVILDGVEGIVEATTQLKTAKKIVETVMVYSPDLNNKYDILIADSKGRFMVTPDHLKTWQGGYCYLKPTAPDKFSPIISVVNPFETICHILKNKAINDPLPGQNLIKKEEDFTYPYVDGHHTIKLAEVTVKGNGSSTFRGKYMGQLDSIYGVSLCDNSRDYVCGCNYLNCPHHKDRTDNTRPIDGHEYRSVNILGIDHNADLSIPVIYHCPKIKFKFSDEELLKRANLSRIKAYYPHREFYQPVYDNEQQLNDPSPDFRNTLLWAPMVTTNELGEATVEFYCSDINTWFNGKIEGVSSDGLLGKASFEFFVSKRKTNKN